MSAHGSTETIRAGCRQTDEGADTRQSAQVPGTAPGSVGRRPKEQTCALTPQEPGLARTRMAGTRCEWGGPRKGAGAGGDAVSQQPLAAGTAHHLEGDLDKLLPTVMEPGSPRGSLLAHCAPTGQRAAGKQAVPSPLTGARAHHEDTPQGPPPHTSTPEVRFQHVDLGDMNSSPVTHKQTLNHPLEITLYVPRPRATHVHAHANQRLPGNLPHPAGWAPTAEPQGGELTFNLVLTARPGLREGWCWLKNRARPWPCPTPDPEAGGSRDAGREAPPEQGCNRAAAQGHCGPRLPSLVCPPQEGAVLSLLTYC